jgi:hypothetical protein
MLGYWASERENEVWHHQSLKYITWQEDQIDTLRGLVTELKKTYCPPKPAKKNGRKGR